MEKSKFHECKQRNFKMESVPLIPKAKVLPNSDISPIIREVFQNEFELAYRQGSSKYLCQNLKRNLKNEESITPRKKESLEKLSLRRENLLSSSRNVVEAYVEHENELEKIKEAEKNVFETTAHFIKREFEILENKEVHNLLQLRRQPQMKALDVNYVNKFKLLQGESGLPPKYKIKSDFRVRNFKKWKIRLETISQDTLIRNFLEREPKYLADIKFLEGCIPKKEIAFEERKKLINAHPKKITEKEENDILRANPKMILFTGYKRGETYSAEIDVKNVHTKGVNFQLKPMLPDSPFTVFLKHEMATTKLFPGLSFKIGIEFSPKTLEVVSEDICISLENEKSLLIPLVAYLEPPILKTHKNINEFTKITAEKIASSYVECGPCFTGDTKVTKLKFKCYRSSGEFFIMSSENWNRNYINNVTNENLLEIPPFRVYPVYFKMNKNDIIDLFFEFSPKNSGTHVENIVITCDNGEVRALDLLGDAIGWHSYFFTFEDRILKLLPVNCEDDAKVNYYLDFGNTTQSGTMQKKFCISNNSTMPFEFQWKVRDANISSRVSEYFKLSKNQVAIEPENGTFEPKSLTEFTVSLTFDQAEVGEYKMVLSLYVLNLPYQCIEEDSTIIQPTGLVRNLYSQSLYGEDEFTIPSPELLSLQGTYESLQESIRSYVEHQNKIQTFPKYEICKNVCMYTPGLCAKPLKKSKTYFNLGDGIEEEGLSCTCRGKPLTEGESTSDSCPSNMNDKSHEFSIPKSEVIWDFVDILVDEVEIFVEVRPMQISIQPNILDLSCSLKAINKEPVLKEVRVINHSQFSISCKWKKAEITSDTQDKTLIHFHYESSQTENKKNNSSNKLDSQSSEKCEFQRTENITSDRFENSAKSDFVVKERLVDNNISGGLVKECEREFVIRGYQEFICLIGISTNTPGKFFQVFNLLVNGKYTDLALTIQGTTTGTFFTTTENIKYFGLIKSGTQSTLQYKIMNEYPYPLSLITRRFNFNFENDRFEHDEEPENLQEYSNDKLLLDKENSITRSFYVNAKEPGIKCSLLEISPKRLALKNFISRYILILGEVKQPSLSIFAPRFGNAILAPSGTMYVGKKISTTIVIKNRGLLNTIFTWGHPFGCHSRKIRISITPETENIKQREKLNLEVTLTPLDEGIISHCYVPCFFCRSLEPLILSVVGIVEKINVTFEFPKSPEEIQASNKDKKTRIAELYPTIMRLPWPIKKFDPNLREKFLYEDDILKMKCKCSEVEKEFGEDQDPLTENSNLFEDSSSKHSIMESEESLGGEPSFKSSGSDKKNSESTSVRKYASKDCDIPEAHLFQKAELEFLNVTVHKSVTKQFVIRNETPIPTKFRISAKTFGKTEKMKNTHLLTIKKNVYGYSNGEIKDYEECQPLILAVEPSQADLSGYDAVSIHVTASGNTWGEYMDVLLCDVDGIQTFNLKVFVRILGLPIYLPMFKNNYESKPILRFQPLNYSSNPVIKRIKVLNTCAISLTISWIIFFNQPMNNEQEEEQELEDSFNLMGDLHANFESNHSDESTKSVKVYLSKNISESSPTFRNMLEMRDFSQYSGTFESLGKTDSMSEKNENQECIEGEKTEEIKNCLFKINFHSFQVEPKEISFKPFEEKYINIMFDPRFCKARLPFQEFKGVLKGFLKLKSEDEKCPGLYYRHCGTNFIFDFLELNAIIENPTLSFEVLKGDLKFYIDANNVINSSDKKVSCRRIFLVKNRHQNSIPFKIEISPGLIFSINKIETMNHLYKKYNPDIHHLLIETGQILEVRPIGLCITYRNLGKLEINCSVAYKDIIYAYEQLKLARRKETNENFSEEMKASNAPNLNQDDIFYYDASLKVNEKAKKNKSKTPHDLEIDRNFGCGPRDSFAINLNRMSSKSDNSVCYSAMDMRYYTELEGEFVELPSAEESLCKLKTTQNVTVIEEEINFIQIGQRTQTLMAELHLSFPAIKLSPKVLDMGNVYIAETAIRYCSLTNLTGSPIQFTTKSVYNCNEYVLKPTTGNLPPTSYNSDIGFTVAVEFTPSQPGYFLEIFQIYCNSLMEFDFYELTVRGFGTWNEKYKRVKVEMDIRLEGPYAYLCK